MGFNRDVIRRRRDQLHEWGVRMRWVGRRPRLWRLGHPGARGRPGAHPRQHRADPLLLRQLRRPGRGRRRRRSASPRTCACGRLKPGRHRREDHRRATSTSPTCPTSTCSSAPPASSGPRTSCCGSRAYAEMVFLNTLWPDFDRRNLWAAIEIYASATGATAVRSTGRETGPGRGPALAARRARHTVADMAPASLNRARPVRPAAPRDTWDVIVIGGGPAGENAADYAIRGSDRTRGDRRERAARRRVLLLGLHAEQGTAALRGDVHRGEEPAGDAQPG